MVLLSMSNILMECFHEALKIRDKDQIFVKAFEEHSAIGVFFSTEWFLTLSFHASEVRVFVKDEYSDSRIPVAPKKTRPRKQFIQDTKFALQIKGEPDLIFDMCDQEQFERWVYLLNKIITIMPRKYTKSYHSYRPHKITLRYAYRRSEWYPRDEEFDLILEAKKEFNKKYLRCNNRMKPFTIPEEE